MLRGLRHGDKRRVRFVGARFFSPAMLGWLKGELPPPEYFALNNLRAVLKTFG